MSQYLIAAIIFLMGYLLNIFFITVLYHRGLTHNAVKLKPLTIKFVANFGAWITGIDPKSWICMHRLHHIHSDTELDPHSPIHLGVAGVATGQLKSYENILRMLLKGNKEYTDVVADIPFDVSVLNRKKLWLLPYFIHLAIAAVFAFSFQSWIIGVAYFLGIMSHPLQGWLVNSMAHKFGYRNFKTDDHSRNNLFVSMMVFGEGYQNNHHAFPGRAKFSVKPYEVDFGYGMCVAAKWVGVLA